MDAGDVLAVRLLPGGNTLGVLPSIMYCSVCENFGIAFNMQLNKLVCVCVRACVREINIVINPEATVLFPQSFIC